MVSSGDESKIRIAIINPDKCKPKKCSQECKKKCPVNKVGKLCIEVLPTSTICVISEQLCIGCGMCVRLCPFDAIRIINLPKGLESQTTHRYGPNSFKLHRLPTPRPGQVLGLVGQNGIGKSTALRILGGNMRPNLGQFENAPDWKTVLKFFRGSELQAFFTKMLEDNLKALIKIQYVDSVAKAKNVATAFVGKRLKALDSMNLYDEALEQLDLAPILERQVQHLSGGELQRFIIGLTCVQKVNIYMFDEPSSYLDVKQRLNAARMIRRLTQDPQTYVIVVEHDLSVLDYLSDFVCCLYGNPGAYGVVTLPFSVREGINVFLSGFIPTENMRFRDFELNFRNKDNADDEENAEKKKKKKGKGDEDDDDDEEEKEKKRKLEELKKRADYEYPAMTKTLGPFKLQVEKGTFNPAETIVMLGQNGTGKTTMIKMLAGLMPPDGGADQLPKLNISYKPQTIAPKFEGNVEMLFNSKLKATWQQPLFKTEVIIPLNIQPLLDQEVQNLSGGEL
jgi:ATP-binding cassette subfamily E protein 1